MTLLVGIDVWLMTNYVWIVDVSGRFVRELMPEREPEALATALLDTKFDISRGSLEAGPLSQGAHAG